MSSTKKPRSASAASATTLFHDDFLGLALGDFPAFNSPLGEYTALQPEGATGAWRMSVNHWSWPKTGSFRVVEAQGARELEAVGASPHYDNRLLIADLPHAQQYRVQARVTPLSFEGASPAGGLCGLLAHYQDSRTYLALVLERDGWLKLLRRRENIFEVLAGAPLAHTPGAPLEFSLEVSDAQISGVAGGIKLSAPLYGSPGGGVGFLSDISARFGPIRVEAAALEAARIDAARKAAAATHAKRVAKYPAMRLERSVPLNGLVNGRNLRLADINGDGKPELILAQGSPEVSKRLRMTRLTCLTVMDLDGRILWQAGVPDPNAPTINGDLPFQVQDVDADGRPEIICVFGYDVQIRDGRTGKVLWSTSAPETAQVGNDFKEVSSTWGAPWGDETLNMDIKHLAVCNTQGRPIAREILVKDDYHHLAVLDPEATGSTLLMRHRGVHGHFPWIGDLDGDGCDEIVAGYSVLDHTGKKLWSLHLQDHQDAIAFLDPVAPGGKNKRLIMCGGEDGLLILGLHAEFHTRLQGHAQRLGIGKFRADLPGLQLATVTYWGNPGIFRLHDATGKLLWSKEYPVRGGLAAPVNWTGQPEELMLYTLAPGGGLLDGHGEIAVEAPGKGPHLFFDTTTELTLDGRDSLIAFDHQELALYVPADAPLKGDAAKNMYRPARPGPGNRSNYQAYVSLPPGW